MTLFAKESNGVIEISGSKGCYANNLSGDHWSFSADGNELSIFDQDDGYWYRYNYETGEYIKAIPRNYNGSVNENFMWDPQNGYWYLNRNHLIHNSSGSGIELPIIEGVQWRMGSASNYGIGFINGYFYSETDPLTHILPINFISYKILKGFWIKDISNDGGRYVRNCVRFEAGFLASLSIDSFYERYFDLDGSNYQKIEPTDSIGKPEWSHPTTVDFELYAGNSSFGTISKYKKIGKQVSLDYIIIQDKLKELSKRNSFVAWHHGTCNKECVVFSLLHDKGRLFDGIYMMTADGSKIEKLHSAFSENLSSNFQGLPRPSVSKNIDSKGYYKYCWHEHGNVYIGKFKLADKLIPPIPPSNGEKRIQELGKRVQELETRLDKLEGWIEDSMQLYINE